MSTENNILLAKFLGYINNGCLEDGFLIHPKTNHDVEIKALNFNEDWNLLMLVIDKIEKLDLGSIYIDEDDTFHNASVEFQIKYKDCSINLYGDMKILEDWFMIMETDTKIEAVYLACIEFIEWYNQQNK